MTTNPTPPLSHTEVYDALIRATVHGDLTADADQIADACDLITTPLATADELREEYAEGIRASGRSFADLDDDHEVLLLVDAVLAVRDRRLEQAQATIERLTAERDTLLAELDGRGEEARERWIQQQLDQTGLKAMDFRNGAEMELEPARELVAHWVAAARALLGKANYSETKLEFDVKVAESPELYTIVIQRHGPCVLTPHEARQRAETALADVLQVVADWHVSAHKADMDAGDLARRLEKAGHPLPGTEGYSSR